MKLPLIDIEWDVLCSGFGFFFHFPSHTYGWICWDTNDAYLVSEAITAGADVYWDNTNGVITATAESNILAGYAIADAAAADAVVSIKINA